MVRVTRLTKAGHLGVDVRATFLGMFERFKKDHAGPLAHDEAAPILVEGPGALGGVIIVFGRHGWGGGWGRGGRKGGSRMYVIPND